MTQARQLFESLRNPASLLALVGTSETLYLEAKEGKGPLTEDLKGYLSQALSGFANSDGGVLIFGLTAKRADKGQPDEITGVKPFEGFRAAASDCQSLLGQAVMPPVDGADVSSFPSEGNPDYGYVIVYVPASDIGPHRGMLKGASREYWKRSGDGFYRMEHFDIADMFGRRRRPQLRLEWRVEKREPMQIEGQPWSSFDIILSLRNAGRAVARYPMLRLELPGSIHLGEYGLDGNRNEGLPRGLVVPSERPIVYAGREGDVIHPGLALDITRTERIPYAPRPAGFQNRYNINFKLAAEDQPLEEGNLIIEPEELWEAVRRFT